MNNKKHSINIQIPLQSKYCIENRIGTKFRYSDSTNIVIERN